MSSWCMLGLGDERLALCPAMVLGRWRRCWLPPPQRRTLNSGWVMMSGGLGDSQCLENLERLTAGRTLFRLVGWLYPQWWWLMMALVSISIYFAFSTPILILGDFICTTGSYLPRVSFLHPQMFFSLILCLSHHLYNGHTLILLGFALILPTALWQSLDRLLGLELQKSQGHSVSPFLKFDVTVFFWEPCMTGI